MNGNISIKALTLVLFCVLFGYSESVAIDYQAIMRYADKAPHSVTSSTASLSTYLCSPYNTDKEKFASIYYWVAKNISYSDAMAKKAIFFEDVKEIVDQVMKTKSGVCQHFSELFAELARLNGLEVYVVNGYTISDGKLDDLTHAWNIVNVSGKWCFIDATWAGSALRTISKNRFPEEFFMVAPEDNIQRKMPFDPMWQALTEPVKYEEFDNGRMEPDKKGNFNFVDLIHVYKTQSLIEKQVSVMERIKANGIFNQHVKREYTLMERNYRMMLFNQEVEKYNTGTSLYNSGMSYYNQYADIKNTKSSYPKYNKKKLIAIIDSAANNLEKAENLFITIKTDNAEMNSYLKKNMTNIKMIDAVLTKERKFVKINFK